MVRRLKNEEKTLIEWIIKHTDEGKRIIPTLDKLLVEEMNDGGMGSLKFVTNGKDNRLYGSELGRADLSDIDKVPIFFTVNLDTDGNLFELDVFKADFSPLLKFPEIPAS